MYVGRVAGQDACSWTRVVAPDFRVSLHMSAACQNCAKRAPSKCCVRATRAAMGCSSCTTALPVCLQHGNGVAGLCVAQAEGGGWWSSAITAVSWPQPRLGVACKRSGIMCSMREMSLLGS